MLCKNVRVNTERFSQQSVAIGRRIRAARERHDWTMTELAKRAGVNHSYVSKVEIGAFGTPSVEKLSAIATALGQRVEPVQFVVGHASALRWCQRQYRLPFSAQALHGRGGVQ